MTRIGVIGSGNIGATLAEAWRGAGHAVVYGSRSPDPRRTVAIAEAITGADVVLLATRRAPPCRSCLRNMARRLTGSW